MRRATWPDSEYHSPDVEYMLPYIDEATPKDIDNRGMMTPIFEDPHECIFIDDETGCFSRVYVSYDMLMVRVVWLLPMGKSAEDKKPVLKAAMLDAAERFPVSVNFEVEGHTPTMEEGRAWRRHFPGLAVTPYKEVHCRITLPTFTDAIEIVKQWP